LPIFYFHPFGGLKKIGVLMLIEYHHGVAISLDLVSGQSATGFTLERKTGVGKFGRAAGLKTCAGGGSALKLDAHGIDPYFGAGGEGFKGASSFESVPGIVVIVDHHNAFHAPFEIAMAAGVGEVHVGGQIEVDVDVYGPGGDLFGYAIAIVTTVKKG
jgi:hypothetical protein